ncbi:hypothetical protein CP985_03460 [Malaciobacter mytili LMG 24559]|uniref:F-type type IV conjugative transfer system protein TraB n=1 Tax=Malaciobacter mytili LMG 24559 TaxID=1032238 RepID=A0AAX2AJG6_9BACT|nr:TrbI/VirB10 family protein [Malaciobacter mytili]AXH16415.1 F-type type IV conjugative transfer system protein TraB [Malaciobacter mytili LMG 24559]RXK16482.1 hypothetical protein CP985_03460 [Malaciobacter mytili LMG 24559]
MELNKIINKIRDYLNNIKSGNDDITVTALQGLKSSETKRKERNKKFKFRMILILIIIPLVFFSLVVLWKAMRLYYAQFDETKITKQIPKKEIKMEINSFTRWQDQKDKEDVKLNKKLDEITTLTTQNKIELNEKINDTKKELVENFGSVKKEILDAMTEKDKKTQELVQSINIKNQELVSEIKDSLNSQINNVDNKFAKSLEELKNKAKLTQIKPIIKLPDLPTNVTKSSTVVNNGKEIEKKEILKEVEIEVEEEIAVADYGIETLTKIEENKPKEEKKTLPSFFLMPGFAKGVIVAGADVPTLMQAATETKPIWISISSEQLMANNEYANFQDCLVEATASGDLGPSRARVNMEKISCIMTDLDGKKYRINTQIKGNVYGEDGKLSAKGRLVSKEGEIIKKGVPLATLEGLISVLAKGNSYIFPTNSKDGGTDTANPMLEFTNAGANTSSKILSKFSEYYLKVLENLNPYVEVKAKREVTLAFKGGELLTPVEYENFDVGYFVNKEIYNEENY